MFAFPALNVLRYCDSNVPAMDKIFFLVKRADAAIENSSSMLNDEELFGCPDNCVITGCEKVLGEVFGESGFVSERYEIFCFIVFQNLTLIFDSHFSGSDSDEEEASLSCMVKQSQMRRKQLLQHDFAITGWAHSILLEI